MNAQIIIRQLFTYAPCVEVLVELQGLFCEVMDKLRVRDDSVHEIPLSALGFPLMDLQLSYALVVQQ